MTRIAEDLDGSRLPSLRMGAVQTVSTSGASAAVTNSFSDLTRIIRIVSTVAVHYKVGSAPTATTSHTFLPASVVEYISVRGSEKIAFIKASGENDGTSYVTEAAQR